MADTLIKFARDGRIARYDPGVGGLHLNGAIDCTFPRLAFIQNTPGGADGATVKNHESVH
jgi:hypothetical protein